MDILSEILNHLNLDTSLYFRTDLAAPWGVKVPAFEKVTRFHLSLAGEFYLQVEGEEAIRVASGDIVLVSHGLAHTLKASPDSEALVLEEVLEAANYQPGETLRLDQGDGPRTQLVCGHFVFEEQSVHPLPRSLPSVLHVPRQESTHSGWIGSTLDFVDRESRNRDPGYESILNRLSELVLIQAIRHHMKRNTEDTTFLAALGDHYIRRSIEEIHLDPAKRWRLEDLARTAGLSRTIYAERFHRLTGTTPINYVTQWRMEKARKLLKAKDLSVERVAELVGYSASESFQRRFKKFVGLTPSAYRRKFN